MDPRIILTGIESFITNINKLLNVNLIIISSDVKLVLTAPYNAYKIKYFTQRTTSTTMSTPTFTSGVRGKNAWSAISNVSRQITSVSLHIELFKYLGTYFSNFLKDSEKETPNILTWWKDQIRNFSILSIMTRDLLTPTTSTVASESAFSASTRQMDKRRSSLSLEILECQIYLKNWMQHEVT